MAKSKEEKEAEKARKKAEKEAKKAKKEKEKVEKRLNKAEKDYIKAMEKAKKEKDPDKRAKKEAKAKENLEKDYQKTVKKYPEATQVVLAERKEAQRQKASLRSEKTSSGNDGMMQAKVHEAAPATNHQQQVFTGSSNAYGNAGKTDIYGNAIQSNDTSSSAGSSDSGSSQKQEEAKTLEEALERLAIALLEAMLSAYMGPPWGYVGDKYAMKGQQFDSRIEEREQLAQARQQENTQTQTQTRTAEDRAAAPVVGELHIGSDGTMTYTDNQTQKSVSQKTDNQQLSIAQMMAISRGGRG